MQDEEVPESCPRLKWSIDRCHVERGNPFWIEEVVVRIIEGGHEGDDLAAQRRVASASRIDEGIAGVWMDLREGEEDRFGSGERHVGSSKDGWPSGPSTRYNQAR